MLDYWAYGPLVPCVYTTSHASATARETYGRGILLCGLAASDRHRSCRQVTASIFGLLQLAGGVTLATSTTGCGRKRDPAAYERQNGLLEAGSYRALPLPLEGLTGCCASSSSSSSSSSPSPSLPSSSSSSSSVSSATASDFLGALQKSSQWLK